MNLPHIREPRVAKPAARDVRGAREINDCHFQKRLAISSLNSASEKRMPTLNGAVA